MGNNQAEKAREGAYVTHDGLGYKGPWLEQLNRAKFPVFNSDE